MFLLPLLAAGLYVGGDVYQKHVLANTRMPLPRFLIQTSLTIAVLGAIVLLLFPINLPSTLSASTLWLFFGLGLLGLVTNLIYYRGFRDEPLSRIQFALLIEPVSIFILAAIFFPAERNPIVWLLGALAFGALLYGHLRNDRISFDGRERFLMGYAVLAAVRAVVARSLLDSVSPIFLYTMEVTLSGLLLFIYFGLPWRELTWNKASLNLIGIGAITSFAYWLAYTSYQLVGVTVTSLVFLLAKPALNYAASRSVFKEELPLELLLGSLGMIAILAYALYALR